MKGYKIHVSGVNAPAPLTDREEALKELQQNEHDPNYGTDARYIILEIKKVCIFIITIIILVFTITK